jgi:hypothetical protein
MENRIFVKANCLVGNAWLACSWLAMRWPTIGAWLAMRWPTIGAWLAMRWPTIDQLLANYRWATIYWKIWSFSNKENFR